MMLRWLLNRVNWKSLLRAMRPMLEERIKHRWVKIPMEQKLFVARKLGIKIEQLDWLETYLQSVVLERIDSELRQ